MGAIEDGRILQQQAAQQQAADNSKYNKDGSGKGNDYHAPPLPTSNFPVTAAGGSGRFMVHRDRLSQVASQMGTEASGISDALTDVLGPGGGAAIFGWETADALTGNLNMVNMAISEFVSDLHTAYTGAVGNLKTTVVNYADAETTNSSAAGRAHTTLPSGLAT